MSQPPHLLDVSACTHVPPRPGTIIAVTGDERAATTAVPHPMLRITVQRTGPGDVLVMKLEGCVIGPWVAELDACWMQAQARHDGRVLVDLRSVYHLDAAGRALLARMHAAGASFMTSGCVMPEVIREVTTGIAPIVPVPERI